MRENSPLGDGMAQPANNRGFSLLEVALVFSIISVLIVGIWVGSRNARTQLQQDKLIAHIVETAENIRRLSPAQNMTSTELYNFMDTTGVPSLIPKSEWANYMPADMIGSGTHPQTPWGTNMQLAFTKELIYFYPTLPDLQTCIALGPRLQATLSSQLTQEVATLNDFAPVGEASISPGSCQAEQDSVGDITLQILLRR